MPVKFQPAKFAASAFRSARFAAKKRLTAPVELTGDPEADSAAEMTALKAGFIARAKAEDKRREKATDSEYWLCMCFQSREQVEAFLRATKWAPENEKYIDGQIAASALGIDLPHEAPPSSSRSISQDWADLALPLP